MSGDNQGKSQFSALLEELGTDLAKALPAADANPGEGEAAAEGEGEAGEGEGEADAGLAKSFKIKLDSGEEIDAVDGAELIKSLVSRIEGNEAGVGKLLRDTVTAIGAQGELIKSLQAEIAKLGEAGKGRKAVVAIAPKPGPTAEELAKANTAGEISGEEFMAKAMSAQAAGRISSVQVATAEAHINAGKAPPADILRAVLQPSA